jgi:hypothetical protein
MSSMIARILCNQMGHALELPLETVEKELPINMQQPLLMQMSQHYPNDKCVSLFLTVSIRRWNLTHAHFAPRAPSQDSRG